jgi:membrane-associated phospholipid phosphatase
MTVAATRGRARAAWSDVGLHRVCLILVVAEVAGLTLEWLAFHALGITLLWETARPVLGLVGGALVGWAYYAANPGSPREWIFPEAALVMALVLMSSVIGAPLQYAALAWQRPIIDPSLSAADRALGISVRDLVHWTAQHPGLVWLLRHAYFTLLWQLFTPMLLLPVFNDRAALWEYAWHFLFCSIVTVVCLAVWPAACVFLYQDFHPLIDQSRFINHFNAARAGALQVLDFGDLEGLVSFPSFHVAGAWMVTWAFRRSWLWVPLLLINVLLSAATVLLGVHYAVDLFATGVMVTTSVIVYRGLVEPSAFRLHRGRKTNAPQLSI